MGELNGLRAHLVYWIAPSATVLLLAALYFSNQPLLMTLLAPEVNRELGLLENLQNLVLLILIGLTLYRATRPELLVNERLFFGLIAAAVTFMLLEELDYGTHFWWALHGLDWNTRPLINVHNQGDNSGKFKLASDIILALLFVIFPLVRQWLKNAWLLFLCPRKMFVLAAISGVLLSDLMHWLEETVPPEPNYLTDGIGEFRELFTYYVYLLYFGTLAYWRDWPGSSS